MKLSRLPITALLRQATSERKVQLSALHPKITFAEGELDSDTLVQDQAATHLIVIKIASSDHYPSIVSILKGLEKNSASNPGNPPRYIHASGIGITSDNARGEWADETRSKIWTDVDLDLHRDATDTNFHLESDFAIIDAGTRKKNPVRTAIIFPSWVYGIGEGVQKITIPVRVFTGIFKDVGHASHWGAGKNRMGSIHVKDVASSIVTILKASLEGKADEGAEGLYFVTSTQPMFSIRGRAAAYGEILLQKGISKEADAKPFPNAAIDPLGHYGWSLLGGNHFAKTERLYKFGWKPTESKKISLLDSLPAEAEFALDTEYT